MIHHLSPGSTRRLTLGADKGFDAAEFVAELRQACVTLNVAQKSRYSAIDRRTARHDGYAHSIQCRKRIQEALGWDGTEGGMAQTAHRGGERVRSSFILTMAANNLTQLPRRLGSMGPIAALRERVSRGVNSHVLRSEQRQIVPAHRIIQRPVTL